MDLQPAVSMFPLQHKEEAWSRLKEHELVNNFFNMMRVHACILSVNVVLRQLFVWLCVGTY